MDWPLGISYGIVELTEALTTDYAAATPGQKRLFYTLDGIRGIAALLVVMRHTNKLFAPIAAEESYLAVDVFFVLSGVVIAQAYGQKLRSSMSLGQFIWIRLVRIMPLYLLGSSISVAAAMLGFMNFGSPAMFAYFVILGVFMLPNPGLGTIDVFPLNNPAWSLPLELTTNFTYAAHINRFRTRLVLATMLLSAGGIAATIILDKSHSLNIGFWARSFPFGFFRVGYSFFAGVFLFSLLPQFTPRFGPGGRQTSAAMPWFVIAATGAMLISNPPETVKPYFDFFSVTLIFPLLVGWGMLCQPVGFSAVICRFLGLISYAVYTLHAPLSGFLDGLVHRLSGSDMAHFAPLSGIAFLLLLIPTAAYADSFYDNPVRRWLLRGGKTNPTTRVKPPMSMS